MKPNSLFGAAVAGAILSGLSLVAAMPVQAVTTGPTVIAVHRDGAVDVPGNSTLGTVATLSVPTGNWSLMATATLVGTDSTTRVECQLIAGTDSYVSRTYTTSQGPGSSQSMTLLLAHHFAKAGKVNLKCLSDGWTGDVLVRDLHVTGIQVGQLLAGDVTYGTGSPKASYQQSTYFREFPTTDTFLVQEMNIPAGTWLVQATMWGYSASFQDQISCSLNLAGSGASDQAFAEYQFGDQAMSLEGVVSVATSSAIDVWCHDTNGHFFIVGSAISAVQVGTLKYGVLGSTPPTTGSGTPTVIGGYGGPGGVPDATSPAAIGSISLTAGSWFVTSKLSTAAATTSKVTCQLKVSNSIGQARVVLDGGDNQANVEALSMTKKLSATANAVVQCDQSAGALGAFYYYLKVFAMKAGTLTDTALN